MLKPFTGLGQHGRSSFNISCRYQTLNGASWEIWEVNVISNNSALIGPSNPCTQVEGYYQKLQPSMQDEWNLPTRENGPFRRACSSCVATYPPLWLLELFFARWLLLEFGEPMKSLALKNSICGCAHHRKGASAYLTNYDNHFSTPSASHRITNRPGGPCQEISSRIVSWFY